jgi:hypothetical protein
MSPALFQNAIAAIALRYARARAEARSDPFDCSFSCFHRHRVGPGILMTEGGGREGEGTVFFPAAAVIGNADPLS